MYYTYTHIYIYVRSVRTIEVSVELFKVLVNFPREVRTIVTCIVGGTAVTSLPPYATSSRLEGQGQYRARNGR